MSFIERERQKREAREIREKEKKEKKEKKDSESYHRQEERNRRATEVLAQSGFVGLVKELSSVVDGEVSTAGGWTSLYWEKDYGNGTRKAIHIKADPNGTISLTGGLLGSITLSPNEWRDSQKRDQALEKAFKHPQKVHFEPESHGQG